MKKILLSLLTVVLLTSCTRESMPYDQLAQCLTAKNVKMYGSDTCPHCKNQKEAFEGSFEFINYVECNRQPDECQKAGVRAYPTWEIGGNKIEGEQSLSKLAELAGCSLTPATAEEKTE